LQALRKLLTSPTLALLVIRLGGAGAGFLTQLVLARLLAPQDLGLFFAATSLAVVASTVVAFGYPEIAPRFIARYQERGRAARLAAFIRRANRDAAVLGLVFVLLILASAMIWPGARMAERISFAIAAFGVPVLAYFAINSGIALALRAFFLSYGPETFLRPVLFLAALAGLAFWGATPAIWIIVAIFFGLNAVLAAVQYVLLRPRLAGEGEGVNLEADGRLVSRWRREGAPQIAVAIYTLLFADLAILFAALVLDQAALAAFGIALKLALLVGFGVQVAHQVMLPDLADAHAARRLSSARETMRAAAVFPLAFTIAALVVTIAFGDRILALFHPDFALAHGVLVVLVGCQVLRALAGPSAQLLMVTGAQGFSAGLCIASTVVLALGNVVFVPGWGLMGAGFAVLMAWVFWLSVAAFGLYRLTGIRCDLVALLRVEPQPNALRRP
jgi:O-antigen/teichoic acid export membrane protein